MEEIVQQIQQGNTSLYITLWEAICDLIAWWAYRYYRAIFRSGKALGGVEVEDLIQSGYLAMVDAVAGYDPSKGSFTTYLGYHIKKEFRRLLGRSNRQLRDPLNCALSLDIPVSADDPEGPTKLDFISDQRDQIADADERIFLEQLHNALEHALDTLPEPQAQAIRLEYYDECTLKQTAEIMGLSTPERARQLCYTGLQRIRSSSAGKQLERFLDSNTSFYTGTGLVTYNQTGTSPVERTVLRREQLREKYEWLMKKSAGQ